MQTKQSSIPNDIRKVILLPVSLEKLSVLHLKLTQIPLCVYNNHCIPDRRPRAYLLKFKLC